MARRLPDTVDVVIPHAGAQGEVAALAAGLRDGTTPYRLILVDDTSTELRQGAMRKRLAASAGAPCIWLRANRPGAMPALAVAMAECTGDVVLVDPRVRLTPGWLDRMRACMASDPRVGIVGTWSTADRDASGLMRRLSVGDTWHLPDLVDEALARIAVPVHPEVGIAVGPCVLIRRAVLEVMRTHGRVESLAQVSAATHAAGLRAVLADDVVAQHVPFMFDPGMPDPDDAAVGGALAAVGTHDPLAPLRSLLASTLAMLERRDVPGVLHVAHARGGGTEHYIRDAIASTRATHRHYVLRIHPDRWTLEVARDDGFATFEWPRQGPEADTAFLRDIGVWLQVDLVHVHSLVESQDDFLRALAAAAIAYLYTAHDMYVPCPSIYLIDASGRYCNATTDLATCAACLRATPALRDIDIVAWRARYAVFAAAAEVVVGPSPWAAETFRAYYPDARVTVMPYGPGPVPAWDAPADNAETSPLAADDIALATTAAPAIADRHDGRSTLNLPVDAHRHVGILGAIGPEKGSRRIDAMVERIRARGLPLRIVVIGYTDREFRFQSEDRVLTVHGPYDPRDVETLCDAYRIDVVAFPTIWPETFCYALSEVWAAGRPALVPARGALGDRVSATQAGWMLDPEADVDTWLDMLMAVTDPGAAVDLAERTRNVRAAASASARVAPSAVILYAEHAHRRADTALSASSRHAIYAAACRAAGVTPLPAAPPPKSSGSPIADSPVRARWLDWLRRAVS